MEKRISVVIPNYNGASTMGKCLEAAFASHYENFEVIVVDDKSEDKSVEIIKKFQCKLICLEQHSGASKARNAGALNSSGEYIFFTDADCLLQKDTLSIVNKTILSLPDHEEGQRGAVIGGTYTRMPYDRRFFSIFQSVFVNYFETKNVESPDYIAAHAMIIDTETFRKSGGFPEVFLPIIEDVEFTHRLRKSGCRLITNPEIQVEHIFDFSFLRSVKNAFRKSRYWNMYSLKNKDFFADSGTASFELKGNAVFCLLSLVSIFLSIVSDKTVFLYLVPLFFVLSFIVNRRLLKTFYDTNGLFFAVAASIYYTVGYPLPVGMGAVAAIISHFFKR